MSNYSMHMARLSARIFGEVPRQTSNKSMKVVKMFSEKPLNERPEIYEYYPRHNEIFHLFRHLRFLGLFRDQHQDFVEEMKRRRKLRGKEKPQKGAGKRAQRKK